MAATQKTIDAILQLRRDNDYNYKKIENTFVPLKGEVCLVDTSKNGLRAKVGDGVRTFKELFYIDEDIAKNVLIRGYLFDNQFYSDSSLTKIIEASVNKIYIDVANNGLYVYNNFQYIPITQTSAAATAHMAGIMKLYNTLGQNTDGTMTQKAITDELNEKIEVKLDIESETLNFIKDNN